MTPRVPFIQYIRTAKKVQSPQKRKLNELFTEKKRDDKNQLRNNEKK